MKVWLKIKYLGTTIISLCPNVAEFVDNIIITMSNNCTHNTPVKSSRLQFVLSVKGEDIY